MAGWSFNDNDGPPVDLSAFGTVAPGVSVILCEASAANFIAAWGLSGVTVIGDNMNNLGRNDEINLLDPGTNVIDRLQYGDQTFPGTIRTNGASGWPCAQALGLNNIFGWKLSFNGDDQSSYFSSAFNVANPGTFVSVTCPADPTGACCEAGACNIRTQADCVGLGLYQGDGTNCSIMCPLPTNALIRITEFMHGPAPREFVEFKNIGAVNVNMTGWSYSDETRAPGLVSLSAFGTVAPGETFVLTENDAGDFRVDWNLPGEFNVIGGNSVNLGAADEINLYDNSGALIDRLTYGNVSCSIDADGASGWPCPDALGDNDILEWRRSMGGDGQGSGFSLVGDLGNPGGYNQAATCLPGSCCVSASCSILSQGDCLTQGGLYFGDGTNCTSHPCPASNNSKMWITEYMYQGTGAEFVEFTNLGTAPVDMTGWSFADSCTPAGTFDLSGFGIVDPGVSVILTDANATAFETQWGLSGVPIVTLPSSELGRNDQLILHDADGAVVDRLDYGDQDFPGTIQTLGASGWPEKGAAGQNAIEGWRLSEVGDELDSYQSTLGDVGNPGTFRSAPAMATWGMVCLFLAILAYGTIVIRRTIAMVG
jgi:predicted extracellular nuclease